jgi:arylsulfatase A-like enzyme
VRGDRNGADASPPQTGNDANARHQAARTALKELGANLMAKKPNILFFHVDNLGMGELGCYGGGILRGADTRRMDQFAREGAKLTHYVVEPQCTPTRSALMTGRFPIRSGNHTIALGGNGGGIVKWERTIAEILSEAGYASAIYGKWHIGAEDGRFPTDHGFDEWYGPLRTYDECMWLEDPHYVPERDGFSHMHEGVKGKGAWPLLDEQLTMETKKTCDLEYQKRALKFMEKSVAADKPFYCYFNHSLMHFPMSPRDEFAGKSTNGDWGDCLLMLDHDFGVLLEKLDQLGVRDNTIVVMCGDNGAEDHLAGRGTGGFFDGSYFSSAEGGIRTPLLIRWPGHPARHREQRDGPCHRHVHHVIEVHRLRTAEGQADRRRRPEPVLLRRAEDLEPGVLHRLAQGRTACGEVEGLQDQLQAPAAFP